MNLTDIVYRLVSLGEDLERFCFCQMKTGKLVLINSAFDPLLDFDTVISGLRLVSLEPAFTAE